MVQMEPVLSQSEQEGKLSRDIWHQGKTDEAILKAMIENHARHSGSAQAKRILEDWNAYRGKFVKVFPGEYRRALGELAAKGKKLAA
jgi:glutamate synthase domain-containing protein 3